MRTFLVVWVVNCVLGAISQIAWAYRVIALDVLPWPLAFINLMLAVSLIGLAWLAVEDLRHLRREK